MPLGGNVIYTGNILSLAAPHDSKSAASLKLTEPWKQRDQHAETQLETDRSNNVSTKLIQRLTGLKHGAVSLTLISGSAVTLVCQTQECPPKMEPHSHSIFWQWMHLNYIFHFCEMQWWQTMLGRFQVGSQFYIQAHCGQKQSLGTLFGFNCNVTVADIVIVTVTVKCPPKIHQLFFWSHIQVALSVQFRSLFWYSNDLAEHCQVWTSMSMSGSDAIWLIEVASSQLTLIDEAHWDRLSALTDKKWPQLETNVRSSTKFRHSLSRKVSL